MENTAQQKYLYLDVSLEQVEKLLPEYSEARIVLEYSCKSTFHYGWLCATLYAQEAKKVDSPLLLAVIEAAVITAVNRDGEEMNSSDINEVIEHANNFPEKTEGEDAERGKEACNIIFQHLKETNTDTPNNMFMITSIISCVHNALEVVLPELSLENLVEGSPEITRKSPTRPIDAVFFDKEVILSKFDEQAIENINMPTTYFPKSINNTIVSKFINFIKKSIYTS